MVPWKIPWGHKVNDIIKQLFNFKFTYKSLKAMRQAG